MNLNFTDIAALSPLLILLFGGLALLLFTSFAETVAARISGWLSFGTVVLAFLAALLAPASHNPLLSDWLRFDTQARSFSLLFLTIGMGAVLLSWAFFKRFYASQGEYYFLLLSAIFGLILIGSAADLLIIFLGLETLSIALYVLCGYMKEWDISREAAMKYFLLGAVAAALLLYGIALLYGATGTTRLNQLAESYRALSSPTDQILFFLGISLITTGFAFKAAIVPFHAWAPDVYEGAPTPVTAFMSVGTKAGAFAAFAIFFLATLFQFDERWNEAVSWLAYATLIYANYVALRQTELRRFFAYSGISHAGFLLIPLLASIETSFPALLFYLAVYAVSTLGAFAVLSFLDERQIGVTFHDLKGLYHRSPWLASTFTLCLLTLAGIPPTAGFLAKFYIFQVAFQAGWYGLVIVGLLTSILAAFYYLRIIGLMFSEETFREVSPQYLWPAAAVAVAAVTSIVLFSIFPTKVIAWLG